MIESEAASSDMTSRNYYHTLDLCRFMAALAVMIYHFRHFYFSGTQAPELFPTGQEPGFVLFELLYRHGNQAVPFFWVLSGFVFAHVYGGKTVSMGMFWGRRFARLYPLHFLTLVLVAALQALNLSRQGTYDIFALNDAYHFILNVFMASSWGLQEGLSFNAPIWSVSAEVLVYFLFWVSLPLLNKYRWLGPLGMLGVTLVGTAVFPGLWAPWCGAYFFLGMLVFEGLKQGQGKEKILSGIFVTMCGVGVWMLSIAAPEEFIRRYLLMLTFPGLIGLIAMLDQFRVQRERSVFKGLGAITYAMYLLHFPVQLILLVFIDEGVFMGLSIASMPFLLTYIGLVLAVAIFCHRAFEKPMNSILRRRWSF